jgi:hypothetical protein
MLGRRVTYFSCVRGSGVAMCIPLASAIVSYLRRYQPLPCRRPVFLAMAPSPDRLSALRSSSLPQLGRRRYEVARDLACGPRY